VVVFHSKYHRHRLLISLQNSTMDFISILPDDTIREILSFFEDHELYVLKHVSKRFQELIPISSFRLRCTHYVYSLELFKWARGYQEEDGTRNPCFWNSSTCSYAAGAGHLHILKWARGKEGEDGSPGSEPPCKWNFTTSLSAARGGHLDVLKWAIENGGEQGSPGSKTPCDFDKLVCSTMAASEGHFEIVNWLMDTNV